MSTETGMPGTPRGHDGGPKPPGWAIECGGCRRVTLMPEVPDMAEARRAAPGDAG